MNPARRSLQIINSDHVLVSVAIASECSFAILGQFVSPNLGGSTPVHRSITKIIIISNSKK